MSSATFARASLGPEWGPRSRGRVGMFTLIAAEAAIFTIFVVAYICYLGKSVSGPMPKDVLKLPIFNTACLLSSSLTIDLAVRALRNSKIAAFKLYWFLTIALGAVFLAGTSREWHQLIFDEGLTISTNLFGTTYYSLVGLHAFHVTVGMVILTVGMVFAFLGNVKPEHSERGEVFSLYWHFVDAVWVVVVHRGLRYRALSKAESQMVPTDVRGATPEATPATINLPAPTSWPVILAFGITLVFAGLLTSPSVSILGAMLCVTGGVGWFRDVLPQEKEETVDVKAEVTVIAPSHREIERLPIAPDLPRALLPLETYPVSAGIKGGLAGSAAMAVLACLYGLLKERSIWYPINLLAATGYAQSLKIGTAALDQFHLGSFAMALFIHLVTSLLVGLLYGAMLPMFPRRPILLGGVLAPVLWTGLLHSILGLINPLLDARIDWLWFIASQFAFGIVAGLVVVRQELVRTRQFVPFFIRAGIEAPGMMGEKPGEDSSR